LNRDCLWHKPIVHFIGGDAIFCCYRFLDNCCSFFLPLTLHSPNFSFGCVVPLMKFLDEASNTWLPNVHSTCNACKNSCYCMAAWHSLFVRVPTIISLVTFLLTTETNQRCLDIPLRFVLVLVSLFAWSPKCWCSFGWWKHPLVALFQAFLQAGWNGFLPTPFSSCLFFNRNGFFFGPSCFDKGYLGGLILNPKLALVHQNPGLHA
jgi:hypothetical protein